MKYTLARQLKRLTLILVVIIVLFLAQFWLWNFVRSAAFLWQDSRTEQQQIHIIEDRTAEMKESLDLLQGAIEQLAIVFPDKTGIPQAVERLERLGDNLGVSVRIQSIDQKEVLRSKRTQPGLIPVTITLVVVASVESVLQYLDAIEHVSEQVVVTGFHLKSLSIAPIQNFLSGQPQEEQKSLLINVTFYLQEEQFNG